MNPGHRQRYRLVVFYVIYPVSWLQPQNAIICFDILRPTREIIKGASRYIDEHAANKFSPFACSLLRVLDAIFPFKHGPAIEAILRQFGEDLLEIDLSITWTAEASRTIFPV